ncbi:hypothetical protein Trydic_g8043 [Trypoxylus dichotomus]
MAPRRSYRSVKVDNNNVNINLVLNDVLCPICRSILIEPVTIPCNHGFCLSCFEGTVANASLTCPLCRVRFSSWHRLAKKDNKIVNINLWEAIKNTFPQQVENKLNGTEENLLEDRPIILSAPGQIRKEYEEQKKRELLEIQKIREAETRASEELIKKIVEEESIEENNLRHDEQYARQLQKEINSINVKSHFEMKQADVPQKLDKITKNGTMNSTKKSVSESNNINLLDNESRYFKPIDIKNIPPSKLVPILKVPAKLNKACTVIIGAPAGKTNFTHNQLLSAFARFEMTSPILGIQRRKQEALPKRTQYRKRRLSNDVSNAENIDEDSPKRNHQLIAKRPCIRRSSRILSMDKSLDRAATIQHIERSPNTRSKQKIINKIVEETMNEECASLKTKVVMESPPCHGFEPVERRNLHCDVKVSNSVLSEEERLVQKKMQEASDLEFAKKLQEELNKGRYTTRSSITHTDKFYKKHRQMKLDEIIKCRNKIK